MADKLEYVVKNAIMMCDKGAAPGMFTPTFNTTTKINGCLATTKADKIPIVNIPPFGACACRGGAPCTPVPVEWLKTYKAKVKGQETILFRSKLPCGNGGKIEFITSGQVPLPDGEMDALMEEFAEPEDEGGWGFWDTVELVPVIGSITGMVREGKKGNWGMVALNAGFLVMDVAGVVSFGSTTAASTAAKAGVKAGIKVSAKAAAKSVAKGGMKQLAKGAAKKFTKALTKKIDDIIKATGKICVFACFPAGTPISVKDGFKNVEDIQVGDLVWAYNEETGESDLKPVVDTIQNEVNTTVKITLENEIIESTVEHPFYTRTGWKDAADLTTEDEVKTKNGTWSFIKKIVFNHQTKKVYNFEVEDWHTYFVGSWKWLVHNVKKCLDEAWKALADKLGIKFIVDNPELLKLWDQTLYEAATSKAPNKLKTYLSNIENGVKMSDKELGEVFGYVGQKFRTVAKKAGKPIEAGHEIHHWNYNKGKYPLQLLDPRNLVEPASRASHTVWHRLTTSNLSKIWKGPIKSNLEKPISNADEFVKELSKLVDNADDLRKKTKEINKIIKKAEKLGESIEGITKPVDDFVSAMKDWFAKNP